MSIVGFSFMNNFVYFAKKIAVTYKIDIILYKLSHFLKNSLFENLLFFHDWFSDWP